MPHSSVRFGERNDHPIEPDPRLLINALDHTGRKPNERKRVLLYREKNSDVNRLQSKYLDVCKGMPVKGRPKYT